MQNYLHISKKSTIFAPDLGIVPAITLKKGLDMKGLCIFKVSGGKSMCRVVIRQNEDGGFYYVVYHGRRLAPTIARYSNVWNAVWSAVQQAACDMREVFGNRYNI